MKIENDAERDISPGEEEEEEEDVGGRICTTLVPQKRVFAWSFSEWYNVDISLLGSGDFGIGMDSPVEIKTQ